MTVPGGQLALKFPLSTRYRFDTFVAGANPELMRFLETLPEQAGFAGALLHGPAGAGRTHLLQAACHAQGEAAAGGAAPGAIYLPLNDPALLPASLEALDTLELVAVDDVDAWIGQPEHERALLDLYQGLHARGGHLLVSARLPAAGLRFHYHDLASRLGGLPSYRVRPLGDADKAGVLRRLAAERGLELPAAVLDFWLARSARDLPSLLDDLDRLDGAAMAAQRRLTVPLLKQVLGL